jgi:periplasmic protein TonB
MYLTRRVLLLSLKVALMQNILAEAMIEENSIHHPRTLLDWVVSMIVHFAALLVLMLLPLYFTSQLDIQRFNLTFLVAPMPPPPPPPPPVALHAVRPVPTRSYTPGELTSPSFIPKAIAITAPEEVAMGVPGGVPGGMPGGQVGGVIGGILGGVVNSVPAPPPPVAEGPKKPLVVGGNVKPPRLIYGPAPEYPDLARQALISGLVVIEAIIDESGNVTEVRAVSGQPLLIGAALKAVSKRKYEPTYLDGQAMPVELRVEVSFKAR